MGVIRPAAIGGVLLLAVAAASVGGCGSASDAQLPPPATPDRAPATTRGPGDGGRLLARGTRPQTLVAPGSGLVVTGRPGDRGVRVSALRPGSERRVQLPAPLAATAADGRGGVLAALRDGSVVRLPAALLAGRDARASGVGRGLAEPTALAPSIHGRAVVAARTGSEVAVVPPGNAGVHAGLQPMDIATLRGGRLAVSVAGRSRTVALLATEGAAPQLIDSVPAGVGPTQVACAQTGPCFVVDTAGDSLLVARVAADGSAIEITRRVFVAGAPYAIAIDQQRRRLWVTLTARNEIVELGAHGRPHILRRLPAPQQPNAIAVDPTSGDVIVGGAARGDLWAYSPYG